MVFGPLTVALRSSGTMSPLPMSAFRIEHIVTVQPDEGLRISVDGISQRFVIHYFNIINNYMTLHQFDSIEVAGRIGLEPRFIEVRLQPTSEPINSDTC